MSFGQVVEKLGEGVDGAGVAVIILGVVAATLFFAVQLRRGVGFDPAYTVFRQGLGRAILLGLELLVAGDIIRTVAIEPTFRTVGVLAIIVLIRTFLSTQMQLEIDGRWPWQPKGNVRPDS